MANMLAGLIVAAALSGAEADDGVRNYGATSVPPATPSTTPATVQTVGLFHRRACFGCGGFGAAYAAYGTYNPSLFYSSYYPGGFANFGGYGAYYRGAGAPWVYNTPNPYGYYPNGAIWGSSGPTYAGPFPVWGSPSGYYGYRYNGWGSYGWGGWGGTGPAGWGYQGGFYW